MPRPNRSIVTKLLLQIIIIILVIAGAFALLAQLQLRETRQGLIEKAELYAAILGTYLDKIAGDNLAAYQEFSHTVRALVGETEGVESLDVVTPEGVVIASGADTAEQPRRSGQDIERIRSALAAGTSVSAAQSLVGRDVVVHYVPLAPAAGRDDAGGTVMILTARFPSQRSQPGAAVRTQTESYFREEAMRIAARVRKSLIHVFGEVQRNTGYLAALVDKLREDPEISDVRLYLAGIPARIFGSAAGRFALLAAADEERYRQAMSAEKTRFSLSPRDSVTGEIITPVQVTLDGVRMVRAAAGIVFSVRQRELMVAGRQRLIVLMSVFIIAALTLIIALFFQRTIMRPVRNIGALTRRISQGDYSERATIFAADEMGDLSAAFNRMADDIQESHREIQAWNERLQQEIREVSDQLRAKQAQLLESAKLASLGVLSSGIAHEINNPLGIIFGNAQMLGKQLAAQGTVRDPQEAQQLLRTIEEHARRCAHIVTSLLQFARHEALAFSPTDVGRCLENALRFTRARLEQKAIHVTKRIADGLSLIPADAIHLEQVFINLILNAERSMSADGTLILTAALAEEGDWVEVRVTDSGEGIAPEHVPKVFEPFFSTREPGEGTGLGLSISYGIIQAHGGTITLESEAGKGTTVIVRLPVKHNVSHMTHDS